MEEAEYKDNEKVLFKARVKLSIPHQKPEEANSFLTEGHVILDAKEVIKIPMHRILHYEESLGSASYGTYAFSIIASLTFFDELYKKKRLSLEADAKDLTNFKIVIEEQTRAEKARSLANQEVIVVLKGAKQALCFTSDWVIIASVGWGGMGYALGGMVGGIVEAVATDKEIKGFSERSPENILLADGENFAIPYMAISKVEVFKRMLGIIKIRITTAADKYEFGLEKPKEFEKTVNNLRSVLRGKLAW